MNLKIIILGGLAMYVAQFVIAMLTGPIIHEGILEETYRAHATFWRPELNQDPPDMAALLPLWITVGVIGSFVIAGIYSVIRGTFAGSGWVKGAKFGSVVWLVQLVTMAGWSGIFNLPYGLWGWWAVESLLYMVVGGAVLGLVAEKLSPEAPAAA